MALCHRGILMFKDQNEWDPKQPIQRSGQIQDSLMRNKHNQTHKMEAEFSFRKDFMEAMLLNFSVKVTILVMSNFKTK